MTNPPTRAAATKLDRGHARWQDVATVAFAVTVDLLFWGGNAAIRWGGDVPAVVPVVAAVVCNAVLMWRWHRPMTAFAALWVYSVACNVVLPWDQPVAGVLVMSYHLARHVPGRRTVVALASLVVPMGLNVANTSKILQASLSEVAGISAVWFGLITFACLLGRLGFRAEQAATLREEGRAAQAALTAQTERLRLARELHDSVASSITSVALQAAGARHHARLQRARATVPSVTHLDSGGLDVGSALEAIETASTEAMRELRRLLGLLHSEDGAEHLDQGASIDDIEPVLVQARAVGVALEVERQGTRVALDRSIDHAAYRVVQEAVTNVAKYGGTGAKGLICIRWTPELLRLEVRNSRGEAAQRSAARDGSHQLGLVGLRERVQSLGGSLGWGAQPDGGFLLWAELPCVVAPTP